MRNFMDNEYGGLIRNAKAMGYGFCAIFGIDTPFNQGCFTEWEALAGTSDKNVKAVEQSFGKQRPNPF